MSKEKIFDSESEGIRTRKQLAGNGLTLQELESIEQAALHSEKVEAAIALRLAAALREALQMKLNACSLCAQFHHTHNCVYSEKEKPF